MSAPEIPPLYFPEALQGPPFAALRALCADGWQLYAIGGYVRDHLLGRPCKDLDIVVLGSGVEAAQAFAARVGSRDVVTYPNFGTALVRTDGWHVEFVGARRESYRKDSRKPSVENGSLKDDQLRRDFTVNALSLDLHPDPQRLGRLVDPFGGVVDLHNRTLRTPTDPNRTFSDDPLRMMRAVRFAATLGFEIHPDTLAAIGPNAERIHIVSAERVADELNKLILAPKPSVGFKHMFYTGLLAQIFPEMQALHGVEVRNGIGHKDNFFHTLKVLDNICQMTDSLWLRWAAILHDIAKPPTKRFDDRLGWTFHGHEERGARMVPKIFRRMKLPQNEKMLYVQKLVRLHLRPIALVDDGVSDSAIRRLVVDAGEELDDLLTLCRADITTRNEAKHERILANYDAVERRIHEVLERDALRNWQPVITGEDIMREFRLAPGPAVGELKLAVRNAILDGHVPNDYAPALAYLRAQAPSILASLGPEPPQRGKKGKQAPAPTDDPA